MKSRKLIITGAGGFLGKSLVLNAIKNKFKVVALVHKNNPFKEDNNFLKIVKWKLDDVNFIEKYISQNDILIHLAAFIPSNFNKSLFLDQCFRYNVFSTENLINIAVKKKVSHFIYYSAGNAYFDNKSAATEKSSLYPTGNAVSYLSSKISAEIILKHICKKYQIPYTIFRISSPYGPYNNSFINKIFENFKKNRPITLFQGGLASADFVFVEDISKLVLKSLDQKVYGTYNVGSGIRTTLLEIANQVLSFYGKNNDLIQIETILKSDYIQKFPVLDCTKAINNLKYSPTPLKEGLKSLI